MTTRALQRSTGSKARSAARAATGILVQFVALAEARLSSVFVPGQDVTPALERALDELDGRQDAEPGMAQTLATLESMLGVDLAELPTSASVTLPPGMSAHRLVTVMM